MHLNQEIGPSRAEVSADEIITDEEMLRFLKFLSVRMAEKDENPGVDYAREYRKQTGRDFFTGEYITQ